MTNLKTSHLIFMLLLPLLAIGQVGIGTITPNAQLEIMASNRATPSNTDGILIPKIDEFPAVNPTAAQDGMMLYITGDGSIAKGFYSWNHSEGDWEIFQTGEEEVDWYKENTTLKPTHINDDIYTLGDVGLGVSNPRFPLDVEGGVFAQRAASIRLSGLQIVDPITLIVDTDLSTTETNAVGIQNSMNVSITGGGSFVNETGIDNSIISPMAGTKIGVKTRLNATGSNASLYGVKNELLTIGTGDNYGTHNEILGSSSGNIYGTLNYLSVSGNGNKYGSYNFINAITPGVHYGVYSEVFPTRGYAGYFKGKVAIGFTEATNYTLPVTRGTLGQLMMTDALGNISWIDPSIFTTSELNDLNDGRTTPSSLFIGINAGAADDGSNNQSLAIGQDALLNSSTGFGNTSIGYHSSRYNTTGNSNTVIGHRALQFNTTGGQNTAIGQDALFNNTIATLNTAIGEGAMTNTTTGSYNTAAGGSAMEENTVGTNNVSFGFRSLWNNAVGSRNTAIGTMAGNSALGSDNVFIGNRAGFNETGSNRLYIENSAADMNSALIYGEFDTNQLVMNADIEIGLNAGAAVKLLTADGNTSSLQLFEGANFGYEFEYDGADDKLHLWSRNFSGNEGQRMTWLKNGNVGIGNNNPAYRLDVAGDINTTGNIRQTGGAYSFPDYVFESYFEGTSAYNPTYQLLQLDEVAVFLRKYKHLPGVQSRAEVAQNGWNLSENVRTNLEKVEELYLHAIAADKRIVDISEEHKILQKKLLEQQTKLDQLTIQVQQLISNQK